MAGHGTNTTIPQPCVHVIIAAVVMVTREHRCHLNGQVWRIHEAMAFQSKLRLAGGLARRVDPPRHSRGRNRLHRIQAARLVENERSLGVVELLAVEAHVDGGCTEAFIGSCAD